MTDALLRAVGERPHVSVWIGARVTALDLADAHGVAVTLSRDGQDVRIRSRLLVAADGGSSHVRAMARIGSTRTRLSTMVGFTVEGDVPCPGFANVFVGPVPVLAYQFQAGSVRVMFDLRKEARGVTPSGVEPSHVAVLPEPFRSAVRRAVDSQQPLVSASYSLVPDAVIKGRLVLVGDAAGCCHPLTATGLSVCTRDARRLRQALQERGGDVPAALRRYAELREGPQRTRLALASALYEAFSCPDAGDARPASRPAPVLGAEPPGPRRLDGPALDPREPDGGHGHRVRAGGRLRLPRARAAARITRVARRPRPRRGRAVARDRALRRRGAERALLAASAR